MELSCRTTALLFATYADKLEAESFFGAAVEELRTYEQAVASAMERNAARAATA